jgi:menaquinol-cytochrome c reductase iron-sulfur subunit
VASTEETLQTSRRTFLAQGIGACLGFLGALIGIPAVGALIGPALKPTEANWVPIGRADSFPEGVPQSTDFTIARRDGWVETTETVAVWVVRQPNGDLVVFNGHCTHLGCAYHWQADRNQFVCPCHAGVFDKTGRVMAGPPPRDLDPLPTRVEGGIVQVQYIAFRLGIPQRAPA